jgi:hypothetical protein
VAQQRVVPLLADRPGAPHSAGEVLQVPAEALDAAAARSPAASTPARRASPGSSWAAEERAQAAPAAP